MCKEQETKELTREVWTEQLELLEVKSHNNWNNSIFKLNSKLSIKTNKQTKPRREIWENFAEHNTEERFEKVLQNTAQKDKRCKELIEFKKHWW